MIQGGGDGDGFRSTQIAGTAVPTCTKFQGFRYDFANATRNLQLEDGRLIDDWEALASERPHATLHSALHAGHASPEQHEGKATAPPIRKEPTASLYGYHAGAGRDDATEGGEK
jgi:hypothetical protein